MERHDAVVIGAGHAGLVTSQQLTAAGVEHVVLDRGRIGETWRSQRWDTFRLNTPTWMNRLPGDAGEPAQPDGFQSAPAFADRLSAYAARWSLPVREGITVTAVAPRSGADGDRLIVRAAHAHGREAEPIEARSVVVASGIQNAPAIPAVATALPSRVTQLHTLEYRNAASLPDGAVLVVGCGQTGGQVTEDLLEAGREVYLSPSRVARCPRRYRGRDILAWLVPAGIYDVRLDQLPDPAMRYARQPLISGTGPLGHTVSIQWLADRGARLVGRIRTVEGDVLRFDDTVAECIRFGDTGAGTFRRMADEVIAASGLEPPPLEDDPADAPHPDPDAVHSPEALDLARAGVGSVIWATGVRGDFGWLPAGILAADGHPVHEDGATSIPGLFVMGFPWLTNRGSGIIYGAGGDAAMIARRVAERAG